MFEGTRVRRAFCIALAIFGLLLFFGGGDNLLGVEMQEETPVDYIIVLDISATMYSDVLLIPTDFLECKPEYITRTGEVSNLYENARLNVEDVDDKYYAKRITIARGALECFMETYGKNEDRIALLVIADRGVENFTDGFWDYSKWPRILQVIKEKENKITESPYYSPLGDALWETVNLFHFEGAKDARKVMLFVSDLVEVPLLGGRSLCDAAEEVFSVYGEEIQIESIFFLCIASSKESYDEKQECFKKHLPSVTMIPVSMEGDFSFSAVERIMYLQGKMKSLKKELDDKERTIMVLEDRSGECEELAKSSSSIVRALAALKLPLAFVLIVSGVGVLWGLKVVFSDKRL